MFDTLGDRMKAYEDSYRSYLPPHFPVIIRIDGKAFHSLTKKADKPFDADIERLMDSTALALCKEVGTCQLAYVQSDEISLLLHPYKKRDSQPWFGNNIQKMVSVSAAIATAAFNSEAKVLDDNSNHGARFCDKFENKLPAVFDSRVFIVPECEVVNYFLWRQQDATRNSISMLAQSLYSHKQLHKKNSKELQELCHKKGINWNDLPTHQKRGRCVIKQEVNTGFDVLRKQWTIDLDIPIFSQDREYIQKYVSNTEE